MEEGDGPLPKMVCFSHSMLCLGVCACSLLSIPKELTWQMETQVITYQPKPDNEIRLGRNVLMPRDLSHCVWCVAWMNEENGDIGLWVVLRKYELWHAGEGILGDLSTAPTPRLMPPMTPTA